METTDKKAGAVSGLTKILEISALAMQAKVATEGGPKKALSFGLSKYQALGQIKS